MNGSTIIGLANNAALLIALGLVFDTIVLRPRFEKTYVKILTGILFGCLGLIVMTTPWEFMPGVIFDTRSIILAIGGIFFGTIPTIIAVLMTGIFRYFQGGIGAWTGIAVIITSGVLGVLWRHKRRKELDDISLIELYVFGVVVHIAMLLWMLSLPWSVAKSVLFTISLPVMILYPIGTLLLGKLLIARLRRKKEGDAMLESEARWRSLTETSPDHILTLDKNFNILFANFAAPGLTVKELIGTPLYQYIEEKEKQDEVKLIFENVLRTGEQKTYETVYHIPEGGSIYYESHVTPRKLEGFVGTIGLTVSSRNITDRKLAEEALKESEFFFSQLFEQSTTSTCLYDPDGTIIKVNPEFCKMFGVEEGIITDGRYNVFKDQAIIDAGVFPLLKEIFEKKNTKKWETSFDINVASESTGTPTSESGQIYLEVFGYSILDSENQLKYVVLQHYDITERKQDEESLRKLSTAVKQSPASVVITDLNGVIEYVNPKFKQLTGYSLEEAVGKNPSILKSGEQPDEFYKEMWDTITAGKEWNGFFHNKKKNGELYWESATLAPIRDNEGKIINYIAVKKDITEQRYAEEQLKASLKEKEILIHEIHHRVKNNMNVISSLLKLQANSIEDDQTKEILKESQNRVYAMSAIHETLHGSENLSEIDLKKYLYKISTAVFQSSSVNPKKVRLINDIEEMPISINQASPIGLIINELISNSLKYAFPDDRKGEINVSVKKRDNQLELVLEDNGVGLPDGFDWKNSSTLGLKLVRTLIENQLDGSIDMESKNGTKFTIKFNIDNTK